MTARALFDGLCVATEIDPAVRLRLAGSLSYVFEQAKDRLGLDPARIENALHHIRSHAQDPGVFARYYDLVLAIRASRLDLAERLCEEIVELAAQRDMSPIVSYSEANLGSDYERFPRLIFAEYAAVNPMASPSEVEAKTAASNLEAALRIIAEVDPSIHDEITALFFRIYVAVASREPGAKSFGGVTSFMAWGGSFINVEVHRTTWEAVQFLVHEVTHALLFGLAVGEPLVLNPPGESYSSPLRTDPRPMDGIFHATLVCARLSAFNRAWVDSGLAVGEDRDRSSAAIDHNARRFGDGLSVVNTHARLSARGRHIVDTVVDRLPVLL